MEGCEYASQQAREPLDRFALELQQLRESTGVSYASLALQVSELRLARGLHEAAARTPRSTVYNCFSAGRARLDTELLRDIVISLTGNETEAESWVARYVEARSQSEAIRRGATARQICPEPKRAKAPKGSVLLILIAAVIINRAGMVSSTLLDLSLFLDMIGTCLAAIVLGPWYGVAVAVAYQGIALFTNFDLGALFVLVNITGALVWGYGVRRFALGSTLTRFTLLGVLTAVACSAVGIPINMFLARLASDHSLDALFAALEAMNMPVFAALFFTNLTTSIIDKLLAGFIALVMFVVLHRRYGFPAAHMPLVEHLGTLRTAHALHLA